jgi:hypothetical protein
MRNYGIHQIVRFSRSKALTTGRCHSDGCSWVPSVTEDCEKHTRQTGHIVTLKEVYETTMQLADGHAPAS